MGGGIGCVLDGPEGGRGGPKSEGGQPDVVLLYREVSGDNTSMDEVEGSS